MDSVPEVLFVSIHITAAFIWDLSSVLHRSRKPNPLLLPLILTDYLILLFLGRVLFPSLFVQVQNKIKACPLLERGHQVKVRLHLEYCKLKTPYCWFCLFEVHLHY